VARTKKKKVRIDNTTPVVEEVNKKTRNDKSSISKTINFELGHLSARHFKLNHIREQCEKWQEFAKSPEIKQALDKWNINPNAVSYLKQKYLLELSNTPIGRNTEIISGQSREIVIAPKSKSIVQRLTEAPSQFRHKIIRNGIQIRGKSFKSITFRRQGGNYPKI
jgi:hypothetical protein